MECQGGVIPLHERPRNYPETKVETCLRLVSGKYALSSRQVPSGNCDCLLSACGKGRTLWQYACEGTDLHISCGESVIQVKDANYGRLDNSKCVVPVLGTPNDNCRFDATCIVKKWSARIIAAVFIVVLIESNEVTAGELLIIEITTLRPF